MEEINRKILEVASADYGMRELKGNSGWEDPDFEMAMRMTGWELGQAWCAYWAEKVWTQTYSEYNSLMINTLRKLFSANAVATWNAFEASSFETNQSPAPGAVVIWMKMRDGKPDYVGDTKWIRGHAGICRDEYNESWFKTFEGNGNNEGGREGIEVASLQRGYNFDEEVGLKLLGFIHPQP